MIHLSLSLSDKIVWNKKINSSSSARFFLHSSFDDVSYRTCLRIVGRESSEGDLRTSFLRVFPSFSHAATRRHSNCLDRCETRSEFGSRSAAVDRSRRRRAVSRRSLRRGVERWSDPLQVGLVLFPFFTPLSFVWKD